MSDDCPTRPAEPAWLTKLAAAGVNAARDRQYHDRRLGTHGAANKGRHLAVWGCACGSAGGMRELKAGGGGLTCPACGGARRAEGAVGSSAWFAARSSVYLVRQRST